MHRVFFFFSFLFHLPSDVRPGAYVYVHRDLLAGGAPYSAFHKRAPQKSELPLQQINRLHNLFLTNCIPPRPNATKKNTGKKTRKLLTPPQIF
jgi:hypothetical protein